MHFNFLNWHSIKTKVTLFTLAVFLISIWSLALYASRMLREDMKVLLGEQQFSTVSLVAEHVNTELDTRIKALERIAAEITPAILGNADALQALLEQRPVFLDLFNGGVLALGLDGTAIAEAPLPQRRLGVNYRDVDSVLAALREGKSAIGRPVVGKTLHAPVFGMASPIHDAQGQVIGALFGVINLSKPVFWTR